MWTAIAGIFTAIFNFFFNRKKSEKEETVKNANDISRKSAEISRETSKGKEDEIKKAQSDSDSDSQRLHDADSVREKNRVVSDAINRANRKL